MSVFAADAAGQQGPAMPRGVGNSAEVERRESERRERAMRAADLNEREFLLRNIRPDAPAERPSPRLALAQLRDDFVRIQVLNNDLMKAAASGDALDLKLVSKSAAEIKKRAARLRDNMALPEPEDKGARDGAEAAPPAELVPALSALDRLIRGFVQGVVANGVHRVDAQASAKTRQELEAIIDLSAHVKKTSERLGKSTGQPR
ncbi:MAG TPA: hypothetical protein VN282_26460 [Pyrinomonadaceae bacterium]|nr:hypothetical protein [Pyrinomonadaceae bacterium]